MSEDDLAGVTYLIKGMSPFEAVDAAKWATFREQPHKPATSLSKDTAVLFATRLGILLQHYALEAGADLTSELVVIAARRVDFAKIWDVVEDEVMKILRGHWKYRGWLPKAK